MARSFNWEAVRLTAARGGPRFWLLVCVAVLLIANCIALLLYWAPPGGSQADLLQQKEQLTREITGTRMTSARLRSVAGKVQLGSREADAFEARYFLPERVAYSAVITELQRMAKAAGVEEREAQYLKEPVEGSDDLTILNTAARFQGPYASLMRFLHEADESPMLLMLDTLQASPQQKGGQIDSQIRFQVVIREQPAVQVGVFQ